MYRIVTAIDCCLKAPISVDAEFSLSQFAARAAAILDEVHKQSNVSWHEGPQTSAELAETDLRQLSLGKRYHVVIPNTDNAAFHPRFLTRVSARSALQRPTCSGVIRAYHDIIGHAGMLDAPVGRTFFDFSFTGELRASLRALRYLDEFNTSDDALSVAAADSIGQTIYHHFKGEFPAVQVPMLHDDLNFDFLRRTAIDILKAAESI